MDLDTATGELTTGRCSEDFRTQASVLFASKCSVIPDVHLAHTVNCRQRNCPSGQLTKLTCGVKGVVKITPRLNHPREVKTLEAANEQNSQLFLERQKNKRVLIVSSLFSLHEGARKDTFSVCHHSPCFHIEIVPLLHQSDQDTRQFVRDLSQLLLAHHSASLGPPIQTIIMIKSVM